MNAIERAASELCSCAFNKGPTINPLPRDVAIAILRKHFAPTCDVCGGKGYVHDDVGNGHPCPADCKPAERADQWMPIESAPKDGTRILLHYDMGLVGNTPLTVFGRWCEDRHHKKPRPYWTTDREDLFGIFAHRDRRPSHWMPLPPAPQDEQPRG